MTLASPVAADAAALWTAWRFAVGPDPHRDHRLPLVRALGVHAFRLQDELLGVPLRWGFFSPGPSRLQAMEACIFADLVATVAAVLLLVAVCVCRGEGLRFIMCCLAVVPVACVSTYMGARRVSSRRLACSPRHTLADAAQLRSWVPPSWKRPKGAG